MSSMTIDYWPSRKYEPQSGRWSKKRRDFPPSVKEAIRRRYPTCAWDGCDRPTEVIDHIVGWADALALGWDEDEINDISNGQGLCSEHHEVKTKEERLRGIKRKSRKRESERHPGLLY